MNLARYTLLGLLGPTLNFKRGNELPQMVTLGLTIKINFLIAKKTINPSLAKKVIDFWSWKERFPWATFLNWTMTVFWQYFWPFYCSFLGQRNRRTTLFAVYWYVVRGYRQMSLYEFLLLRASVRRHPPVPKNCKISLLPVPASGEQKKIENRRHPPVPANQVPKNRKQSHPPVGNKKAILLYYQKNVKVQLKKWPRGTVYL